MKKVTAFSISEGILSRLDQERELASRSAVVEDILKKHFEHKDASLKGSTGVT